MHTNTLVDCILSFMFQLRFVSLILNDYDDDDVDDDSS